MAEAEATTLEQIAEYESQLAGIVDLLEASPGDESLLALKKDMEELLELSKASLVQNDTPPEPSVKLESSVKLEDPTLPPPPHLPPPPETDTVEGIPSSNTAAASAFSSSSQPDTNLYQKTTPTEATHVNEPAASMKKEKPHKAKKTSKKKKVTDFVLPDHLIPNEGDSEAERNKKRRAAKSLKSKWRQEKKEIESNNRQKSWQSFQKKSHSSSGSIFSTNEGFNDRVGVVSKKQLTEFGARKRHK